MKQETTIQCLGCGAGNIIPAYKDVVCCSYCGGGIQRPIQQIQDLKGVTLVPNVESQQLYDAIINDPLVRSFFIPPKKSWYIELSSTLYYAFGLQGFAAIAFGLFILFHIYKPY